MLAGSPARARSACWVTLLPGKVILFAMASVGLLCYGCPFVQAPALGPQCSRFAGRKTTTQQALPPLGVTQQVLLL